VGVNILPFYVFDSGVAIPPGLPTDCKTPFTLDSVLTAACPVYDPHYLNPNGVARIGSASLTPCAGA
jgi:hypothetical protein